ncbi:ATP synthase F1 complex subunit delta [Vibrio chagasii]|jgi:F-type H+-transporting ATPase subunit delta|uniref:ATP synthase subunit delta n=1 Tax=Vibrio chagasii TaxID=170679 RepID=A0A2S7V6Z9_9VIBR|nr:MULTISPECIES: F0F1 ATP synthase subunit delta [Vibrio]EDK27801.1 F0F1 ATP synthase subunit delta [Vibrionales bacterium SWAT-3]MDE9383593.1 F0F1 ATP synthase subunit delta [Vibrio alginolyticus]MEC7939591.1 F0F1 ATP synthase subunit delta [Pseudomonadota bacterium]EGU43231.1 F0F1 ATP synthase subunit delta [Vibrio splendidus ATCC 33789]KAB0479966.1 F0F1 ATP synthase subunit delta [Vibrio chagasii]|tara:strand:- start:199 stop:732 length:534 start_codon:yes stop_codon:yes gene_type:complete
MSDLTTIARPYAKAAFDFAVEKGELDQWSQMLSFAAEVAQNNDIHNLLSSSLTAEKLAEVFIAVCGEQFDEFGQNLIKVMAENGRLMAFPDVCKEFLLLKQEHEKEIDVEVTSAVELSEEQRADISSKLEQRLARKVQLNCSIDETLLSGVIIRAGDLVIDNSARGRLDRLSDALQS